MATGAVHIDRQDIPIAKVTVISDRYRYIVVEIGLNVTIFLPDGPAGSDMARRLAAELLRAADLNEAPEPEHEPVAESETLC